MIVCMTGTTSMKKIVEGWRRMWENSLVRTASRPAERPAGTLVARVPRRAGSWWRGFGRADGSRRGPTRRRGSAASSVGRRVGLAIGAPGSPVSAERPRSGFRAPRRSLVSLRFLLGVLRQGDEHVFERRGHLADVDLRRPAAPARSRSVAGRQRRPRPARVRSRRTASRRGRRPTRAAAEGWPWARARAARSAGVSAGVTSGRLLQFASACPGPAAST